MREGTSSYVIAFVRTKVRSVVNPFVAARALFLVGDRFLNRFRLFNALARSPIGLARFLLRSFARKSTEEHLFLAFVRIFDKLWKQQIFHSDIRGP